MLFIKHNLLFVVPFIFVLIPFVLIHRILEIRKYHYLGIKTTRYREVGAVALIYSLIFIGTLTLGTSIFFFDLQFIVQHIHDSIKNINIIPFKGMIEFGIHGIVNIFGNIFMFMPFGFFVALFSKKDKRIKHTVLAGAGVSLVIEIIQIFVMRYMDINDIILNTLGAFLGFKLLNLLEKRFSNFLNKFAINKTVKKLTLKEKIKVYAITILQVVVWIIMSFNLKQMVMSFYLKSTDMPNLNNIDPFKLTLLTLPLLVFIISIVMQFIFKKRLIILLINFALWMIAVFTLFNSNFLIYCFIYTFISLLGTLIGDLIIKSKNKLINKRIKSIGS
ncbi:VanZ family protein [Clostridium sp. FP2]|uniref:VanZ family protein n=1 Tax=Clostridium TaxID=1485 RepID=UPI0013E9739E|nr:MULTISPECIES: VanZ family protein [Clostridium]MBW9156222.1 VanZ family protein [Clostridium tagluense]MBZ9625788.1 VanZ family protein [Clostridium sp. FP2]WLC65541.1 VanZ family protein [Clostridium tagluense]